MSIDTTKFEEELKSAEHWGEEGVPTFAIKHLTNALRALLAAFEHEEQLEYEEYMGDDL